MQPTHKSHQDPPPSSPARKALRPARRRLPTNLGSLRRLNGLPVDPFVLALLATVGLAALLPASGTAAEAVGGASTAAIALLFFLYGARLSTREALEGLRHWRLHLTILACTFVVFPVLGLAAAKGLGPLLLTPQLASGLLFLTLVPSTVQSSIAFTSLARGNVPAAICAGSFSSLAGIALTPLLAALLLGGTAGGLSADALLRIVAQLLVPFLAGQAARRWIAGLVGRHRKTLSYVDRGAILLVVYTAFSEGMVRGCGTRPSPGLARRAARCRGRAARSRAGPDVVRLRTAGLRGRTDRDPVRRSKKSLAAGLPMAGVLFGAQASLAVLPLMLFHQMQLMVCAVIARRARRGRDRRLTAGPSPGAGGGAGGGGPTPAPLPLRREGRHRWPAAGPPQEARPETAAGPARVLARTRP